MFWRSMRPAPPAACPGRGGRLRRGGGRRLRHLLAVLGARTPDYWAARVCGDSLLLAAPGACALVAGAASGVALFRGAFWIATAALLALFAGSMSAATYLCSFPFKSAKVPHPTLAREQGAAQEAPMRRGGTERSCGGLREGGG